MPDQTPGIQDRLAAVWESHMHDGNGATITAVFLNVLRAQKNSGVAFEPFELQDRVIETAFEPFENPEDGGLFWAVASNTVTAMANEFRQWINERKAGADA